MVSRRLRLYSIKFVTYHDFDNDPENCKAWFLDGKCELIPRNPEDLAVPVTRFVRPRGTWTIVATVQRTHREPISLVSTLQPCMHRGTCHIQPALPCFRVI